MQIIRQFVFRYIYIYTYELIAYIYIYLYLNIYILYMYISAYACACVCTSSADRSRMYRAKVFGKIQKGPRCRSKRSESLFFPSSSIRHRAFSAGLMTPRKRANDWERDTCARPRGAVIFPRNGVSLRISRNLFHLARFTVVDRVWDTDGPRPNLRGRAQ